AMNEDSPRTLTESDFFFSDPVDGNAFAGVIVTTGATNGMLTLNGVSVADGTLVSAAEIAAGHLVFAPAQDANGSAYASFTFQVQDDGGTDNSGVDSDQSPNSFTFDVTPVNDDPVIGNLDSDGAIFTEGAASALIDVDAA